MNRTSCRDIFYLTKRKYGSALYISGRRANKNFAFLSPHLDFEERFLNINKLQKELTLRKVNMDAIELKQAWEFYKSISANRLALETRKHEIGLQVKELMDKTDKTSEDEQQFAKLLLQAKTVKEDVKAVREMQWDLDESIIVKLLKLPSELDERTPPEYPTILKHFGRLCDLPENDNKSHIEIGRTLDLLQYKNPMQYYLSNDAALFELGILNFAGKILADNEMIRIAGSDFSRSILVEGSGLDHEDFMDTFILQNDNESNTDFSDHVHLVGGASLPSMLALHAKQLIQSKFSPIKYYSIGRQYTPFPKGTTPFGLFTVCQASAVQIFLMMNDLECTTQFEKMLEVISDLYSNITDHYRVVMRPAPELRTCEKLRVSFELWSPFSKRYIEAGYISTHGKYLSKRLLIGYETAEDNEFSSIISGTILSVPRVLGCLLEQNSNKFIIPPKIVEQMPIHYTMDLA
ncbi:hypothetical protein KPH14_010408 [Odynerus spinipes]|uniref:Aminoacyl-tRNA synthetase class II (G/ P/ S/T) domain-containing protein n=1 Tax=Odynerus spinipes TaxID=1348599 RepID=A0AAD9RTS9_9HYME|nr:hypothetical protein KPH14_010408 [Odynerus spinipes]